MAVTSKDARKLLNSTLDPLLIKNSIKQFFSMESINLANHYHVILQSSRIYLWLNETNPPVSHRRKRYEEIMIKLHLSGLVVLEDVQVEVDEMGKLFDTGEVDKIEVGLRPITSRVYAHSVTINESRWKKLIGNEKDKPDSMQWKHWAAVPPDIRIRWSRFNTEMRKYIATECWRATPWPLAHALLYMMIAKPLEIDISGIIMVQLPGGGGDAPVKEYDLMEVLAFPRDPEKPTHRKNPETKQYFSLHELQPYKSDGGLAYSTSSTSLLTP